jgi:thiamine biosynthesis lipoprotein
MRRDSATPALGRRRFLKITASACGVLVGGLPANAGVVALTQWRGVALGAGASITLRHRDADRIISACRAEIDRLEDIFSLYRPGSALSRLNASGRLDDPPFEMLELLGLCGAIHAATSGLFDPTIQPLWAVYAESHAQGAAPTPAAIDAALSVVGWDGVRVTANTVGFVHEGMALTLNGIAQGYIADRVAKLLRAEGLTDVLVNTGEFHALGGHPDGGGWPVMLDEGLERPTGPVDLRDMAMASSAPLGTIFDREGRIGHILHPVTGFPAASRWRLVSVVARTAALADGLTTAMCLMSREEIDHTLARFPHARLAHLA